MVLQKTNEKGDANGDFEQWLATGDTDRPTSPIKPTLQWLGENGIPASDNPRTDTGSLMRARTRAPEQADRVPDPLNPLAQRLFDRLHDETIYEHHTMLTPARSPCPDDTDSTPEIPSSDSAATDSSTQCEPSIDTDEGAISGTGHGFVDESRILFDEVTALHAHDRWQRHAATLPSIISDPNFLNPTQIPSTASLLPPRNLASICSLAISSIPQATYRPAKMTSTLRSCHKLSSLAPISNLWKLMHASILNNAQLARDPLP